MKKIKLILVLTGLLICFNSFANMNLINKIQSSNNIDKYSLNKRAIELIIAQSNQHIYKHRNGVVRYSATVFDEFGVVNHMHEIEDGLNAGITPTVKLDVRNFSTPLNMSVEFNEIYIKSILIKSVHYTETLDSVTPLPNRIFLESENERELEIELIYDSPEDYILAVRLKGISYTFNSTMSPLKILDRKIIDHTRKENIQYTSGIEELDRQSANFSEQKENNNITMNVTATWPNKIVPQDAIIDELSWGISVLYIVHPTLFSQVPESILRSRMTIPGFNIAADIFQEDRLIDGNSGMFFRITQASYQTPANSNRVMGFIVAPPSLCSGTCSLDYSTLINQMQINEDIRRVKRAWKADIVTFLHPFREGGLSQIVGRANVPTSPFDPQFNAYSVAFYEPFDGETLAHEWMHNLGALHSVFEGENGPGTNKAFIGSVRNSIQQGSDVFGFNSFMASKTVCEANIDDENDSCQVFRRLSSPNTRVNIFGFDGGQATLGNVNANNLGSVSSFLRVATQWGLPANN